MMRFNIFNQIHKALRALLYDTALTLQQTHFANPDEAELALEKLKQTLEIFDKHAAHEDCAVLPAIQQYEPSLVDAFEKEHEEDHALAGKLRDLLAAYDKAGSAKDQVVIGHTILHSFIAFLTFNLEHMAKEETVLNERLWRYYSDAEIIAINQKIIAAISQEEMRFTSAWMMKGLSNAEITAWLKSVQTNAPEAVFNALFTIAEKELPNQRFRKILEDLTEGAMVA
jgi:hemerythrin-like domain-containing protein